MKAAALAISALSMAIIPKAMAGNVLPDGVEPFSVQQVIDRYSGYTVGLDRGGMFFSPDGSVTAYSTTGHAEEIGVGNWTVNGNEFCSDVNWKSKRENTKEIKCKKIYKLGSGTIIQETKDTNYNYLSVYPDTQFLYQGDKVHGKYLEVEKLISQ